MILSCKGTSDGGCVHGEAEAEKKNEEAKTPKVIARKPQPIHKQLVVNSFHRMNKFYKKTFDFLNWGGVFLSQKLFFFRFTAKDICLFVVKNNDDIIRFFNLVRLII